MSRGELKLARTIRFDASDLNIFPLAAEEGEWAVIGSFAFHDLTPETNRGKRRQAFANGFLGTSSFGFSTFVSIATASVSDREEICIALASHFIDIYGAPGMTEARQAASSELDFMQELCAEHRPGTLLTLQRSLTDEGIREQFRHLSKPDSCSSQSLWTIIPDETDSNTTEQRQERDR